MNFFAAVAIAALPLTATIPSRAQGPGPKPPAQPTMRDLVDGLAEPDLARVLPLLREHYVHADKLTDTEVARSTAHGLLDRLAAGARIVDTSRTVAPEISPFRSEIINGRVSYVRFGSITATNLAELDSTFQNVPAKPGRALVLDLRASPPSSDFEVTAKVCERFCPKGKVLFTIRRPTVKREQILTSKEDPRFSGVVVVLVDHDTAGAAEVIAAVLRIHVKALVIGQQTRGEAVEFADLPLPSGKLLRVATAEIALPQELTIFPGGVKPDLPVDVPQETTDALLKVELEKGVGDLISESERPHMNEAALVAGINPELDALAQRNRGDRLKVVPARDAVLQRALDFVTTISIYETSHP